MMEMSTDLKINGLDIEIRFFYDYAEGVVIGNVDLTAFKRSPIDGKLYCDHAPDEFYETHKKEIFMAIHEETKRNLH